LVRTLLTMVVLLSAALAGYASAGKAAPFDDLVVFGDSLSDTGNAGRFSDGAVWVELIASSIGAELRPSRLGGTNYAVGGARSHGGRSDLRSQLHAYLSNGKAPRPQTLFVVYGGANDLLARGCGKSDSNVAKTAAAAIAASVNDLAAAGARTILVPNLPDIGVAPVVRMQGAACREQARRLSRDFNAALERQLRAAEARHGIRLVRLDVFALGDEVMADPANAGFAETDTPCGRGDCERALFWDHLHPTSRAHSRLAAAALQALGIAASQ
jgi:outer membrane lipase/esterase